LPAATVVSALAVGTRVSKPVRKPPATARRSLRSVRLPARVPGLTVPVRRQRMTIPKCLVARAAAPGEHPAIGPTSSRPRHADVAKRGHPVATHLHVNAAPTIHPRHRSVADAALPSARRFRAAVAIPTATAADFPDRLARESGRHRSWAAAPWSGRSTLTQPVRPANAPPAADAPP
jgi:hypothetical protein